MKQLSGLDASFLYMETPTTYGHVSGLGIYTRPNPAFDPYRIVRERFGSMVGHVEPFRRRVVEVPFGLDHPYWVDDPHFDLDYHVRQIGLAPPGNDEQLADQVARIIGRQMDRTHPLWEVYVIEGLADGRWALLTKFHHATVDGAAGVIIAATHPIMSGPAVDRLKNSPAVEVVVTNTLPLSDEQRFDKLTCLSIAPLLSQAIREVFEDGSVTKMFDGQA